MSDNVTSPRARGFPFLELAIVLVVLGIAASIVAPRMSRGAGNPAAAARETQDQMLVGRLKTLRAAIAAYTNEHGGHAPDPERIAAQLTTYSDWSGRTSPTRTSRYTLGPYIREIPAVPVGSKRGSNTIGLPTEAATAWTYDSTMGRIHANTLANERDWTGRSYVSY
jgi:prepilin-type N-terminal cleavage/methylation domain-containing protein